MKLLDSFVREISLFDEIQLEKWLSDGLADYYDRCSPKFQSAALAFRGAWLSFGRDGYYSTAVSDLTKLYEALGDVEKNKFSRATARSIELLSVTDQSSCEILRALIELALEIKSSHSIETVTRKLCILDVEARNKICREAAFFLSEGHAPDATLQLAKTILERIDFPYEISARLLIALCTYDLENAVKYAMAVQPKLEQQLMVLRLHPEQFDRFKSDFAKVLLRSPNESPTVAQFLHSSFYAQLLEGALQCLTHETGIADDSGRVVLLPIPSLQIVRRWITFLENICSYARRFLRPDRRGLRTADTLEIISQATGK